MLSAVIPECGLVPESLGWAHPVVREWFVRRFGTPTEPQEMGWPHFSPESPRSSPRRPDRARRWPHFLSRLTRSCGRPLRGGWNATQVVYVSPLKALSNDIQKNLEAPLREIQELALEHGYLCPPIRAGFAPATRCRKSARPCSKSPPHILVTLRSRSTFC